jgi:uncharacterized protein (TIRG00374 family)
VTKLRQVIAGIAISTLALWLTLRGKDLDAIAAEIRAADYRYLAPYVAVLLAIHLARTVRWGILLEPMARVPFARLNAASAVGFMAVVVLPFRLGEFARPYLVADRPRLRVSAALSSIVVERLADGVFTGVLLVAALLAVPDDAPRVAVLRTGGIVVSLVFAAGLLVLALIVRGQGEAITRLTRSLEPLSPRLAERAGSRVTAFIQALRVLPSPPKLVLFLLLTAAYWGLNAYGMSLLARGFGFDLGAVASCALLGVLVVGVMIPSGPGMIGTFQGAVVVGLSLFAPPDVVATRGTAYANVLWAVQLVVQVGLGLVFLFSRHIRLAEVFRAPAEVGAGLDAEQEEYRSAPPPR